MIGDISWLACMHKIAAKVIVIFFVFYKYTLFFIIRPSFLSK